MEENFEMPVSMGGGGNESVTSTSSLNSKYDYSGMFQKSNPYTFSAIKDITICSFVPNIIVTMPLDKRNIACVYSIDGDDTIYSSSKYVTPPSSLTVLGQAIIDYSSLFRYVNVENLTTGEITKLFIGWDSCTPDYQKNIFDLSDNDTKYRLTLDELTYLRKYTINYTGTLPDNHEIIIADKLQTKYYSIYMGVTTENDFEDYWNQDTLLYWFGKRIDLSSLESQYRNYTNELKLFAYNSFDFDSITINKQGNITTYTSLPIHFTIDYNDNDTVITFNF